MGMGKGHKARRREQEAADASAANILNVDPDASLRTHMLFPSGVKPDGPESGAANSPTFFKMLTTGQIFGSKEKGLPFGGNVSVQDQQMRYRDEDPFTRGKQVTFDSGDTGPWMEKSIRAPERRPNSYSTDTPRKEAPERPPFTSLQEPYRYFLVQTCIFGIFQIIIIRIR